MEQTKEAESKEVRQKKMLLVLPVLFIPFLTLAFYGLGGGKGKAGTEAAPKQTTVNRDLPGVEVENKKMDKLAYYEAVAKAQDEETAKLKQEQRYDLGLGDTPQAGNDLQHDEAVQDHPNSRKPEASEKKIYAQLEKLNRELERGSANPVPADLPYPKKLSIDKMPDKKAEMAEIDRLENMIRSESKETKEEDPEMKAINTMLEKIMDIQHPNRVQEREKEKSILQPQAVFPVSGTEEMEIISLNHFSTDTALITIGGFFGLESGSVQMETANPVARAVIHETLVLQTGDDLRLRLQDDIFVNGVKIPAGELLTGKITVDGQRPKVTIENIVYHHTIYPVKLQVFDLDGMPGLKINGSINRDAAQQGADNALRNMQLMSLDPSMGAQVATAGIEAAKGLFSKKLKAVKVTVKAAHQVLLVSGQ